MECFICTSTEELSSLKGKKEKLIQGSEPLVSVYIHLNFINLLPLHIMFCIIRMNL